MNRNAKRYAEKNASAFGCFETSKKIAAMYFEKKTKTTAAQYSTKAKPLTPELRSGVVILRGNYSCRFCG